MAIPDHPRNVQRFKGESIELSQQFKREVVKEVRPLTPHLQMMCRQQPNGFSAIAAAKFHG